MICSLRRLNFYTNLNNVLEESRCCLNVLLNGNRKYSKSSFQPLRYNLVIREPFTMKIDSPQFKACITEEVLTLNNLFKSNGHELRIVGGAVRDLLLGLVPKDLDFATTATPAEMKELFTKNEIRLINLNGEKHGTITSRINERNFEVTTLRIDSATNGRHAEVEFTKDWVIDANRRDLTINAMYLGLDGTLYDYFNGYEDLKKRKLRFVGDAETRIQEDYLRILRYFRFYGVIAEGPDDFNEDILKTIEENKDGLKRIAGERIWVEIQKIAAGNFVGEILLKMLSVGIGPCIGLPRNPNVAELKRVTNAFKMKDKKASPIVLMTALFNSVYDLEEFCLRIKPSKNEREISCFILTKRAEKIEIDALRNYKKLLFTTKRSREFVFEFLRYLGKFDMVEELELWNMPVFPVNGNMLKEQGLVGKRIGYVIEHLKEVWWEHDCSLSAEELLKFVPQDKLTVKGSQPK